MAKKAESKRPVGDELAKMYDKDMNEPTDDDLDRLYGPGRIDDLLAKVDARVKSSAKK